MKYMAVDLQEITKSAYYTARTRGPIDAERPLGFITTHDGMRMLFISDGGKFYKGRLLAHQTNEMFMRMQFNEVREYIRAQFQAPEAA